MGAALSQHPTADYWHHEHPAVQNAMWVFGTSGVSMYSVDGGTLLRSLPNTQICLEASSRGEVSQNCGFKDAVSDGQKHVFASNTQGGAFIEVFSIMKGVHVASIPTCGFPYLLDYAPHRDEMWVQCWSPDSDEGDLGHLDTFSTNALGLDHQQVALKTLEPHGHGNVLLDASIPNFALGLVLDLPEIHKVDANTKQVVSSTAVPGVSGFYRASFCPTNQHLFARAYVCCSCGVDGDTQAECSMSRGGPDTVNVTNGPNAGAINVLGHCGRRATWPSSNATHNIAVITSTMDNYVVLADFSQVVDDACDVHLVTTTTLELSNATDSTSNHGRGAMRSIAWAVGSNYVWINSNGVDEVHVIELDSGGDITKAKVLHTLPNLPSTRLVYVTNYAEDAESAEEAEKVAEAVTAATAPILSRVEALDSSTDKFEAIATAGLALGLVGFLCGAAALGSVLCGRRGPGKPVQREISFDKTKGGISTTA